MMKRICSWTWVWYKYCSRVYTLAVCVCELLKNTEKKKAVFTYWNNSWLSPMTSSWTVAGQSTLHQSQKFQQNEWSLQKKEMVFHGISSLPTPMTVTSPTKSRWHRYCVRCHHALLVLSEEKHHTYGAEVLASDSHFLTGSPEWAITWQCPCHKVILWNAFYWNLISSIMLTW